MTATSLPGSLDGTALNWPTEVLRERLAVHVPDVKVEVVSSLASTNTCLLERARTGDVGACVLIAEHQHQGRGRLGRAWESAQATEPGASLTCSFGMVLAPKDWSGLSLAVGLAAAEALGERVQIKWPNDLWLVDDQRPGRKLAGILVETVNLPGAAGDGSARFVVAGIGVNVRPLADNPRQSTANWVGRASVSEWWPQAQAPDVLLALAEPVLQALCRFGLEGFAPLTARYAARDLLAGRAVRLLPPGVAQAPAATLAPDGTAGGVDSHGRLLLHTATGVRVVSSGEVSVRTC